LSVIVCGCDLVYKVILFGFELAVEKSREDMLIYLGVKFCYLCPFVARIRRK
jgi:hypothetical protein